MLKEIQRDIAELEKAAKAKGYTRVSVNYAFSNAQHSYNVGLGTSKWSTTKFSGIRDTLTEAFQDAMEQLLSYDDVPDMNDRAFRVNIKACVDAAKALEWDDEKWLEEVQAAWIAG